MDDESSESNGAQPPARFPWIRRLFDWRVWLGLTITVVSIGWAIRGIPIRDVVKAMEGANFWALLLYSAPFYTASVYVRSLRWRHLTNPISPIARPLLFRAESLGFMVNNLLPLRVGEVVRLGHWLRIREPLHPPFLAPWFWSAFWMSSPFWPLRAALWRMWADLQTSGGYWLKGHSCCFLSVPLRLLS